MRILTGLCFMLVLQSANAVSKMVFVSFSMPKPLLEATIKDSAALHIPAYLNGLHHNSMQETALEIMKLSELVPDLNLQIDPTAFERYGITQVPALVCDNGKMFDVIYGNLQLEDALERIHDEGECLR